MISSVILLQTAASFAASTPLGSLDLLAEDAYIHNTEGSQNASHQDCGDDPDTIGHWTDKEATVEWDFKITKPANFEIIAEISLEEDSARSLTIGEQVIHADTTSTRSYGNYVKQHLGTITIDGEGNHNIRLKPDGKRWKPIDLRLVELKKK